MCIRDRSGADAAGSCQLRYPDKVVTLTYSKTAQSRIGSEILGDEGTLVIDSISQLTGMRLIRPDGTEAVSYTHLTPEKQ